MPEILTYDEIRDRHDGEWVLVGSPDLDEHYHVLSQPSPSHMPY